MEGISVRMALLGPAARSDFRGPQTPEAEMSDLLEARLVVLDLRELTFIDSCGVAR
ncbi:MAG: hypothetical protein M3076_20910 [Actinomycetota bacterium]|nr:hypothetical protein [Actinomycetota bacterium]